jgi:DNA topoisomerase-3
MLETFSKKCVKDSTSIVLTCSDTFFEAKGSIIKQAGWQSVFNEQKEKGNDEDGLLPEMQQGETLLIIHSEILEKQTKPKSLHTEATLLAAMESAGKEVENETRGNERIRHRNTCHTRGNL